MIELRHISKRFGGAVALDDVSLSLAPGERLAVVGENGAGKTSLMNVLYGLYQPDSGEVAFDGAVVRVRTPADALGRGVGMVHQHFTLVPTLTVAENVVLGQEPSRLGVFDAERAAREVKATCERFGFSLDPQALVGTLTVGSQQKVEIVKALHRGVKTLILDEPTAVLTPQEADELFAVTRKLSESGLAVVLISHKLKEVLRFATRIAVMRRGKLVAQVSAAETSTDALAELMVGGADGAAHAVQPERSRGPLDELRASDGPLLRLTDVHAPGLKGLSLELRGGEILGIAGVDGNGQRELAEVVTGLLEVQTGKVELLGREVTHASPGARRELGLAHIPEDRLRRAVVVELTVEENVSLGRQRRTPFARGAAIDFGGRRKHTEALLTASDVRPRAPGLRLGALSGGNQQKLVVGRELDASPKVLVVVQPTRGLDIAAVRAVRERLLDQRARGCAVLLISLDLDEVLALSDRVLVMFGGAVSAPFSPPYDERALGQGMLGVAHA